VKAQKAVGRPVEDVISGWATLAERITAASTPTAGASRAETLPVDVKGSERWLSISAVRFPGGTVYAFRDLTEERAVDQLKSDFVSTVSHELRTPLAAIYGAALTLQRDDVRLEESQRTGLLDVISSEADRLARIVNDILWASRLDSGKMGIAIESCDGVKLARQVLHALQALAPSGVELAFDAPEALPPVAADPDKLRQVLTNLVDNAVKYSPEGGTVRLSLSHTGNRIRFRVDDEGLGIPASEQSRIFEKFFRLDPNLTRGVGGTGLGLYICRELVHRMHGRIWVASDGRRGSTFTVDLPVAT
jgi:signal transduction histidine kinase